MHSHPITVNSNPNQTCGAFRKFCHCLHHDVENMMNNVFVLSKSTTINVQIIIINCNNIKKRQLSFKVIPDCNVFNLSFDLFGFKGAYIFPQNSLPCINCPFGLMDIIEISALRNDICLCDSFYSAIC